MAISLPKLRLNETAPMRGSRRLKVLDEAPGLVPAAVIDEDHLPILGDAAEDRQQALAERRDVGALVVDRDDDAELVRRHWMNP
jgi:hypothetical protein